MFMMAAVNYNIYYRKLKLVRGLTLKQPEDRPANGTHGSGAVSMNIPLTNPSTSSGG